MIQSGSRSRITDSRMSLAAASGNRRPRGTLAPPSSHTTAIFPASSRAGKSRRRREIMCGARSASRIRTSWPTARSMSPCAICKAAARTPPSTSSLWQTCRSMTIRTLAGTARRQRSAAALALEIGDHALDARRTHDRLRAVAGHLRSREQANDAGLEPPQQPLETRKAAERGTHAPPQHCVHVSLLNDRHAHAKAGTSRCNRAAVWYRLRHRDILTDPLLLNRGELMVEGSGPRPLIEPALSRDRFSILRRF